MGRREVGDSVAGGGEGRARVKSRPATQRASVGHKRRRGSCAAGETGRDNKRKGPTGAAPQAGRGSDATARALTLPA